MNSLPGETPGPRRRHFIYLRPWRFEPALLAVFFGALATAIVAPAATLEAEDLSSTFIRRMIFALAAGLLTYGYFRIAQTVMNRAASRGWIFCLLSFIYGPYCLAITHFVGLPLIPADKIPLITASPIFVFRAVSAVLIVSILAGTVYNRIDAQRIHAEELQHLAEQQRRDLLSADEKVRQQVASILHDRFQSELVTSSLALQAIARDSDPVAQSEIEVVIARLDALHAGELRDALLTLGPNLEHVDLQAALRELASQFAPAMHCEISVADRVDFDRDVAPLEILRGLYRICEQSLINSLKHGQATRAIVAISLNDEGIELTIVNNGHRLVPQASPAGRGTSVINSWCSALGGTWSLTPGTSEGAILTVHLPRTDRITAS